MSQYSNSKQRSSAVRYPLGDRPVEAMRGNETPESRQPAVVNSDPLGWRPWLGAAALLDIASRSSGPNEYYINDSDMDIGIVNPTDTIHTQLPGEGELQ